MELTFGFVCRFLPHVNTSHVHILTFCDLNWFEGHGGRKRNVTITGLNSFKVFTFPTLSARCKINLHKTTGHNPTLFHHLRPKWARLVAWRY